MFKKSIAALAAMISLTQGSAAPEKIESRHVEVRSGWRLSQSKSNRVYHGPIGIKRNRKTTTAAQLKRAATKRRNIAKRGG